MEQSSYQVRLAVFEGPLDLLLHLIEQHELDITAISLAQVTDQYLDYLRILETARADDLAEFIVVAARLMLIKSRALLPQPPKADEQDDDIGDDLVRQLVEYRRFKQIAQFLSERTETGAHMYPRTVPVSSFTPKLDLGQVTLDDLIAALQSMLQAESPETEPSLDIVPNSVTIAEKIEVIQALLGAESPDRTLTFHSLLADTASKIEVIVTLLAILEMIRRHRITVSQEHPFGEILISPLKSADA